MITASERAVQRLPKDKKLKTFHHKDWFRHSKVDMGD
jgi:hypothetical protein